MNKITEDNILELSPHIPQMGGRYAFISQNCTWWTTFPEDLKKAPAPFNMPICPYCGSTLLQEELEPWLKLNKDNRDCEGMKRLFLAHHRNAFKCYNGFSKIKLVEDTKNE